MLNNDIAFCAGFFDADGCVSIKKTSVCLCFYNDNKQVLEKIRDVLSIGNNISSREKPKGGTSYTLSVCKRADVIRIAELFLSCSLVTVKNEKLIDALGVCLILDDKTTQKQKERIATMQTKTKEKAEEIIRRREERIASIQRRNKEREDQVMRDRQARVKQQIEERREKEAYIRAHPEMPSRAIAAEIGVSHVTVIKLRREIGLKQYRQREMSDDNKQFIIDHPELSSRAVGAQIGFSHVTVCRFRKLDSARAS